MGSSKVQKKSKVLYLDYLITMCGVWNVADMCKNEVFEVRDDRSNRLVAAAGCCNDC